MRLEAFGPFTMTAIKFAELMPHERTEMALLVREKFAQDGNRRKLHRSSLDYCNQRHSYSLPSPNVPATSDLTERLTGDGPESSGYPFLAASIIRAIHEAAGGVLETVPAHIAKRFNVTPKAAAGAMNTLIQDGLIKRVGGNNRWSITVKGRRIFDSILTAGERA